MRIIISGGGTGGHVFPAIAIADALKRLEPDSELLFVGAKGKLEMQRVPKAGYRIKGLWISGFQRKLSLRNLLFPLKLAWSMLRAYWILRRFRPQAAVGVGGYASGPVLKVAGWQGVARLIQEQNSHAGVTNRLLAKGVDRVCVAYEKMERFFPKDKLVHTGNPVRQDLLNANDKRSEAFAHFGFDASKKTLLVLGGSLGARTLNESMRAHLTALKEADVQVLWQAGRLYIEEFEPLVKDYPTIQITAFIERMDLAYALADVVISRAGALSISELCVIGKAAILVPSPNVAEDHQTKNSQALVEKEAALLIADAQAPERLLPEALALLQDEQRCKTLAANSKAMGIPDAAERIAKEVLRIARKQA